MRGWNRVRAWYLYGVIQVRIEGRNRFASQHVAVMWRDHVHELGVT